mgnify:FL=1
MPAIVIYTDSLKPGTAQLPVFTVGDDQNWSMQFNNGTNLYNPTGVRMDIGYIKGLGNQTFESAFQLVDRLNNRHTGSFVVTAGVPASMTWDERPVAVYGNNGAWLVKGRTPPSSAIRKVYVNYGGSGLTAAPAIRFQGGATATGFRATGTATLGAGGIVASISLTAPGYNYSITPELIITGDGTPVAVFIPTMSGGKVTAFTSSVAGSMYTTATVTVRDPEASATCSIGGSSAVTGLVLTSGGAGYTSAPTVVIASPFAGVSSLASEIPTLPEAEPVYEWSGTGTGGSYTASGLVGFTVGAYSVANGMYALNVYAEVTAVSGGAGMGQGAVNGTMVATAWGQTGVGRSEQTLGGDSKWAPGTTHAFTFTVTAYTGSAVIIADGTFTFPPAPAQATAALANSTWGLSRLTLTGAGTVYTSVPTISFSGGTGSGAQAVAEINASGQISNFTITNTGDWTYAAGSGPLSECTLTFTGGGGTGAAGVGLLSGTGVPGPGHQSVVGVRIDSSGSGYATAPTVGFTLPSGFTQVVAPTATVTAATGVVTGITLTNPGSGYGATAPTVTITAPGGGGVTATATAQLIGSPISPVLTITAAGSAYNTVPAVTFTGGAGTGAAATAQISLGITAVTMRQGGYAYTSLPSVHTIPNTDASFECSGVESHSVPFVQNFNPATAQGSITATPFTSGRRDTSGNLVYDDSLLIVRPRYLIQPTLTLQADALTWAGVFTPVNAFVNAVLNYRRSLVADVEIWGEGRLLYVGSLTILKA